MAALVWATPAQDAPASRPDKTLIVDPMLVGSWDGTAKYWQEAHYKFSPDGELQISSNRQFSDGDECAFIIEAADGQWLRRRARRGDFETEDRVERGTYKISRSGKLEWSDSLCTTILKRHPASATEPPRPALTRAEEDALETLPAMLQLLRGGDASYRTIAALRLAVLAAERPPAALEAIPDLIEHLEDSFPAVRWHCVTALANLGAEARVAGTALLKRLNDLDPRVRYAVVDALRSVVGDPALVVPALVTALADSDPISSHAGHELGAMGDRAAPAAEALARTVLRVRDENHGAWFALRGLSRASAAPAAPVLIDALRQHPESIRRIGGILMRLGPFAKDAAPLATSVLENRRTDRADRVAAAQILGAIGPDASSAVATLTAVSGNPKESGELREAAQDALYRIGGDRDVPFLVQGLASPGSAACARARRNLRNMPVEAVAAEIARALRQDPRFQVLPARQATYEFLIELVRARHWDEPVKRRLLDLLKSGLSEAHPGLRRSAIEGLAHVDAAARQEVATWITAVLQDPDLAVVVAATLALRDFKSDAASSAPALLVLLRDPDDAARRRWASGGTTIIDVPALDTRLSGLLRGRSGDTTRKEDAEIIARYRAAEARLVILGNLADFDLYGTLDEKGQLAGAMAIADSVYDLSAQLRGDPERARQAIALVAPLLKNPPIDRFFYQRSTPAITAWGHFAETLKGESMSAARAEALARIDEALKHPNAEVRQAAAQELKRLKKSP